MLKKNTVNKPDISVILPVFNSELYIKNAVESILSQTIQCLELIIVDDCSTDGTGEILRQIGDNRIVLIVNTINYGVIYSRNLAISRASGDFIALMDSDDISSPLRLEHQMNFLIENPKIDVVGTAIKLIDGAGNSHGQIFFPECDAEIFSRLHIIFPFANPSLMFRASTIRGLRGYSNQALNYVEDYELIARKIDQLRYANLDVPLLFLRKHSGNNSSLTERAHISASVDISHKLIESRLNKVINRDVVDCIHSLGRRSPSCGRIANDTLVELYQVLRRSPRVNLDPNLECFFGMRIFLTGFFSGNFYNSFGSAFRVDPFFMFRLLKRLIRRAYGTCEI